MVTLQSDKARRCFASKNLQYHPIYCLLRSGIAIAVLISTVALYTHFRLVATEGTERGNETPQQIAQEVLTGEPTHANQSSTNNTSATNGTKYVNPESLETPAQRAAEGH